MQLFDDGPFFDPDAPGAADADAVVEDSALGVLAAHNAGMLALWYRPDPDVRDSADVLLSPNVRAQATVFRDMTSLPELLGQ